MLERDSGLQQDICSRTQCIMCMLSIMAQRCWALTWHNLSFFLQGRQGAGWGVAEALEPGTEWDRDSVSFLCWLISEGEVRFPSFFPFLREQVELCDLMFWAYYKDEIRVFHSSLWIATILKAKQWKVCEVGARVIFENSWGYRRWCFHIAP